MSRCPVCDAPMPGNCEAHAVGYNDCEWIERTAEEHPWMFPERGEISDVAE